MSKNKTTPNCMLSFASQHFFLEKEGKKCKKKLSRKVPGRTISTVLLLPYGAQTWIRQTYQSQAKTRKSWISLLIEISAGDKNNFLPLAVLEEQLIDWTPKKLPAIASHSYHHCWTVSTDVHLEGFWRPAFSQRISFIILTFNSLEKTYKILPTFVSASWLKIDFLAKAKQTKSAHPTSSFAFLPTFSLD